MVESVKSRASFAQSIKAVAWSFFGVRRRQDHEADVSNLNPVHVIIAGIMMAVLFVLTLITIVRWVVG
ncbi:MAG: DUF2970 domain-containing protein [Burkholderiaceae bacterium]